MLLIFLKCDLSQHETSDFSHLKTASITRINPVDDSYYINKAAPSVVSS